MQRNQRDMAPNNACRQKSHGHGAELMTIGVHEKKRQCCNRFNALSDTNAEVEIEAKKVGYKPEWMKPPGLEPLIGKTKSELLAVRAAQRSRSNWKRQGTGEYHSHLRQIRRSRYLH